MLIIIVNLMTVCKCINYEQLSLKELVLADLKLELVDAALYPEKFLLKGGLLGLQGGHMGLQP
jgi:hypothetical protein